MSNSFVIADTHFSHRNSWEKFKLPNGDPLRPFTSNEEMDETMVERWNAKVKPGDHVYHLGDVGISKSSIEICKRLNGKKRLVRGNHDHYDDKVYLEAGFQKLLGVRVFVDKFILSHIPLHPDCITDRFRACVHGHLHANEVMRPSSHAFSYVDPVTFEMSVRDKNDHRRVLSKTGLQEPDPRYLCVSVEHTNYEPLSFEEVEERIQKRWDDTGYSPPVNAGWGNGSGPG